MRVLEVWFCAGLISQWVIAHLRYVLNIKVLKRLWIRGWLFVTRMQPLGVIQLFGFKRSDSVASLLDPPIMCRFLRRPMTITCDL